MDGVPHVIIQRVGSDLLQCLDTIANIIPEMNRITNWNIKKTNINEALYLMILLVQWRIAMA